MGRMFGTDGVRGVANRDLTASLAFNLGYAACRVLGSSKKTPLFVVGTDTRRSGYMLENALCAGIMSAGGNVISAGVVPTPTVAVLTRYHQADAGVVISASHNPFYDNGIKFFNSEGFKLADEIEDEIESYIKGERREKPAVTHENVGTKKLSRSNGDVYWGYLIENLEPPQLDGLNVALDCAHGATYLIAPEVFTKMGAKITAIGCSPNGANINDGYGSTHVGNLKDTVINKGADFGFAFDGDGDRLIAVDENGQEINGDKIMYICGVYLKDKGLLKKDTVVVTVMSNMGLKLALNKAGITVSETKVGDRYILQRMIEEGYNFGGEQSGHVIYGDVNTTGDGIATAILLSKIIKEKNMTLSELAAGMMEYPQVLINAKVDNAKKKAYLSDKEILKEIEALNNKYASRGRVLIRPSGTEPLVRVMIEGENQEEIRKDAKKLAEIISERSK